MQWLNILTAVASAATALGVGIAAWQLRLTKQQARTQFEDGLALQYRSIISQLPVEAMLGEPLDADRQRKALSTFYDYFDLSNEQAFLRREGRISDHTWNNWKEGIEQNLARPAFDVAWAEVSRRAPESFNTLRDEVPAARKHKSLSAEDRENITSGQAAALKTPGA